VLGDLRADRGLVREALACLEPPSVPGQVAIAMARRRVVERLNTPSEPITLPSPSIFEESSMSLPAPATSSLGQTLARWRVAGAGLAAAAALTFFVGTPVGRTAASEFLAQFRSQRFAVVTIDSKGQGNPFADLEKVGTIQGQPTSGEAKPVASVAEASHQVGFAVKQPDPAALPADVNPQPQISVMPASRVRFTINRAKALAYFRSIGHPEIDVPANLDGASLVVDVPAAALLQYEPANGQLQPHQANGKPAANTVRGGMGLVIGQAGLVTASAEGSASLDEIRNFLLGMPSLSPQTARQLRAISDWRNTLPIPVPVDLINWQNATIAGNQGVLLADRSGLGSVALYQQGGHVYGVAGSLDANGIQRVAASLR
jgi:hypothetical protein